MGHSSNFFVTNTSLNYTLFLFGLAWNFDIIQFMTLEGEDAIALEHPSVDPIEIVFEADSPE